MRWCFDAISFKIIMKELLNDRHTLEQFALEIYDCIVKKFPKYKKILTPEKLKQELDNPQKLEEYKKSVEVLKKDKQAEEYFFQLDSGKKLNNKTVNNSIYRIAEAMIIGGDFEETEEQNKKVVEAQYSIKKAEPFIKEAANKMLNTNLVIDANTPSDLAKEYIKDPSSYKVGFVSQHFKDPINNTEFNNENYINCISINAGFFQESNAYQQSLNITSNILNYILPKGISSIDLLEVSPSTQQVFEKYKGYEEIAPQKEIIPNEVFQNYVSASLEVEMDIEKKKTQYQFFKEHNIKDSKEFVLNYYFTDENGKKLNTNEVFEKNPNDAILNEYTLEEKKDILDGFNKPVLHHIYDDKELFEKMTKDTFAALAKEFPDQANILTEQNALEEANDPIKLEKHKLAVEIDKKMKAQEAYGKQLQEDLKLTVDKSLARNFSFYLDLSETQAAKEKNEKFIKQISTKQGAMEFIKEEIKKIHEIDWSKFKDMDELELLKNYDSVTKDMKSAFVIDSMISTNGGFSCTSEFHEYFSMNKSAFESLQYINQVVFNASLPYYPIIPQNLVIPKDKYTEFSSVLNDIKDKYKDEYVVEHANTPIGKRGLSNMMEYGAVMMPYQFSKEEYKKIVGKINEGVISPQMFKNNYYLDENNKQLTSEILFKENAKFKVCTYTQEQKDKLEKAFEKPIVDKKLNYVRNLLDKKETLQDFMKSLRNAKSVFKFTDSTQYNDLITACNKLDEVFNSAPADFSTITEAQKGHLLVNLNKTLKEVNRTANDYIEAKRNQSKNATRQLRYELAHTIVNFIDVKTMDAQFEATKVSTPVGNGSYIGKTEMVEGVGYPLDEKESLQLQNDVDDLHQEENQIEKTDLKQDQKVQILEEEIEIN